jgi:hypothetical protein
MISLFPSRKPGALGLRQIFKLYNKNVLRSDGLMPIYQELGDWDKGFSEHYNKKLKDLVDDFEVKRVSAAASARKKLLFLTPFFFIIPFIGLNITIWEFNETDEPAGIGVTFSILLYGAIFWYIKSSILVYQVSIKEKIYPHILEFIGDFTFSSNVSAQVEKFEKSGLLPAFSKENNEDQIIGKYKSVQLQLFETHLQKWRKSGKRSRLVTVFNGLVINLSMSKDFSGKTVVKQDRGSVGNWFEGKFSSLENVRLEDPKFEEIFEVYSTDQIEARYLLTVSFMERLLELADIFDNAEIQLCFENNNLLMVVPLKKPIFEPGPITDPENFVDDAQSLLKEMHLICQIVDTLKLNMKLNL